jgi:hypothetical protein
MKYRIKETVDGNDKSAFEVQEKILWWWTDSMQWSTYARFSCKEHAEWCIRRLQTKEVKYHTVEQ